MRRINIVKCNGNSLLHWHKAKNPLIVIFNFLLIYPARYFPSLALKRLFYRLCGAKIGKGASFGLGATLDIFFPELLEVGQDAIIGYNTVLLGHEFLQGEYRTGKVEVGARAMVGANCTILPGVEIGDGATVSAMSLVNCNIPPGETWGGVPARRLGGMEKTRQANARQSGGEGNRLQANAMKRAKNLKA